MKRTVLMCINVILSFFSIFPLSVSSQLITLGFSATPNPSIPIFQPIIKDSSNTFAAGFRRVRHSQLVFAIIYLANNSTYMPIWTAERNHPANWATYMELKFDGSLVLRDGSINTPIWSTPGGGDHVVLQSTGNLQILNGSKAVVWQSFDFPTDTILEGQNLTTGTPLAASVSGDDPSSGIYSMKLNGSGFGLYADFRGGGRLLQMYWWREAMQEKAVITPGGEPVYGQVSSEGFLGLYQNATAPVDVLSFDSFQRKTGLRILKIEPDGNLRSYFWDGSNWASDFMAIKDKCELPRACGPLGICDRSTDTCSCIVGVSGIPGSCVPPTLGSDTCRGQSRGVRTTGVDLPYKEFFQFRTEPSRQTCEASCTNDCTCWGAFYNNASRSCYRMDYPVQTFLHVQDVGKTAYVKVLVVEVEGRAGRGLWVWEVVVLVGVCLVLVGMVVVFAYGMWWRRKRLEGLLAQEGLVPGGPYRDIKDQQSLELSKR